MRVLLEELESMRKGVEGEYEGFERRSEIV